jgi:hypothetical protein
MQKEEIISIQVMTASSSLSLLSLPFNITVPLDVKPAHLAPKSNKNTQTL